MIDEIKMTKKKGKNEQSKVFYKIKSCHTQPGCLAEKIFCQKSSIIGAQLHHIIAGMAKSF